MASEHELVVAVFASDKGPGDPERASLMSEFGRVFARKGARIVCLADAGSVPVPLIAAARMAGGRVDVLAEADLLLPPALEGVAVTVLPDRTERLARLTAMASVLVGLPGSLASVTALFGAWSVGAGRPVVLLNRHKAYEVVRGFATDVLSAAMPGHDRKVQFAESVDELWNKVVAIDQRR